jgi:thioesterase domain-containing protein
MINKQFEVEFTRDGLVHDQVQVANLLDGLDGATDLLTLAHGWNNDRAEAGELYDRFLGSLAAFGTPATGPGSRVVVMRIFWPSKKFADRDLIPGGGAASVDSDNTAALRDLLAALRHDPHRLGEEADDPVRAANIDAASAVIDRLEDSGDARREFVLRIRAVLDPVEAHEDDASLEFFTLEPEDLFGRYEGPVPLELPVGTGGAAALDEGGAAAFLGDLLEGPMAAARRIANFATYYQMKTRAGAVGRAGVAATLLRVRDRQPDLPIHLIGHSFGGRLVTAAAAALPSGGAPTTMALLQAAFSHNGLAEKFDGATDGAFRTVLHDKRITGPIVITHTKNDKAVGIAYPLASRIARDDAAALGDRNDPYGGMGRNGAQHTPEVSAAEAILHPTEDNHAYAFEQGKVYNLNADDTIKDHGDVTGAPVIGAVWHALRVRQVEQTS